VAQRQPGHDHVFGDRGLVAERIAHRRTLRQRREIEQLDAQVKLAQAKLDAITDTFQNQRGHLTVINYNIETAHSASAKDRYKRQAEAKRNEQVKVEMPSDDGKSTQVKRFNYDELEKLYNGLRDEKAKALLERAEKSKTPSELAPSRSTMMVLGRKI